MGAGQVASGPTDLCPDSPLDVERDTARAARLRAVLGLATALMLLLSWPLWVDSTPFPRVPFVAGLPRLPSWVSWVVFVALVVSTVAAAAGVAWRALTALSLFLVTFLVLQDQHRFQPWIYQYAMLALLAVGLPRSDALRHTRWWFASIYFYSGLSKLDRTFCDEMGLVFLSAAFRRFGLEPREWPDSWRVPAILAMPVFEIAVAVALCAPRTRRAGLVGALVIHAALLMILGPWGLRHSTIVLVWNVAMMVELAILFGPRTSPAPTLPIPAWSWPVRAVFWAAVVLPLGERWGFFDAWPSHALYASHVERTTVDLHEDDLGEYPEVIRRQTVEPAEGPWRRLDLTGWSRAIRGVPVYPQGRACNGLAEALAARYGGPRLVRVVHWGRADRWTGRRTRMLCLGLEEIRRQGDRYWLNAHPAEGPHQGDRGWPSGPSAD